MTLSKTSLAFFAMFIKTFAPGQYFQAGMLNEKQGIFEGVDNRFIIIYYYRVFNGSTIFPSPWRRIRSETKAFWRFPRKVLVQEVSSMLAFFLLSPLIKFDRSGDNCKQKMHLFKDSRKSLTVKYLRPGAWPARASRWYSTTYVMMPWSADTKKPPAYLPGAYLKPIPSLCLDKFCLKHFFLLGVQNIEPNLGIKHRVQCLGARRESSQIALIPPR